MPLALAKSLVVTEWLAAHPDDPERVIVDGSVNLPSAVAVEHHAATLAFALHLAGKDNVAMCDSAWTEAGQPADTHVDTGTANR